MKKNKKFSLKGKAQLLGGKFLEPRHYKKDSILSKIISNLEWGRSYFVFALGDRYKGPKPIHYFFHDRDNKNNIIEITSNL